MSEDWTPICSTDAMLTYQLTDGSNTEYTSPRSSLLRPNHIYYGKYVHICVFFVVFRRLQVCHGVCINSINTERQKNVDLCKSKKPKLVWWYCLKWTKTGEKLKPWETSPTTFHPFLHVRVPPFDGSSEVPFRAIVITDAIIKSDSDCMCLFYWNVQRAHVQQRWRRAAVPSFISVTASLAAGEQLSSQPESCPDFKTPQNTLTVDKTSHSRGNHLVKPLCER